MTLPGAVVAAGSLAKGNLKMSQIKIYSADRLTAGHVLGFIGRAVGLLAMSWLFAWVLLNWVTGCGETFPTADGGRIAGECVPLFLGYFGGL